VPVRATFCCRVCVCVCRVLTPPCVRSYLAGGSVAEATLAMVVELLAALLSPPEMLPSDLQVGL
jgi:hypothetical protein